MDITALMWILLVAGAVVAGAAFVGVLVLPRSGEPAAAAIGIVSFALAGYALGFVADAYHRLDAALYAFAFMVAGLGGGWALASSLLERAAQEPHPVQPIDDLPEDNGKAAALVLSCAEPDAYRLGETSAILRSLTEEELVDPSLGAAPFLYFAQKARYRAVGGTSPAPNELRILAETLEGALDKQRFGAVDWAGCSGPHRLAARVRDLVLEGYRTIIVAELAIGESLHLSAAKREVDTLRLESIGVRVSYTDPLGDSELLVSALVNEALGVSDDPALVGVVLVGHGQPESRSRRNPAFDEQESSFLNRLRLLLTERGVPQQNVRVAWAEWREPDVTSAVRHLVAVGCQRVAVLPAAFPVDTIATRLDLEIAVRQARTDESVVIVTMPAWRDEDAVVAELAARSERLL